MDYNLNGTQAGGRVGFWGKRGVFLPLQALGLGVVLAVLTGSTSVWGQGFQLIKSYEEIAERGKVPSYLILMGSNRFTFLPPPGWNVSHSVTERKVTLVAKDLGANISFSILPAEAGPEKILTPGDFKQQLGVRYPDAKILKDFPVFSGGQAGFGVDLELTINKQNPVSMRVAVVPYAGGKVEFSLTGARQSLPKYYRTFGSVLGSFQVGEPTPPAPPKK